MSLSRRMTPGACTTIVPQVAGAEGVLIAPVTSNRVGLGFLPGDVNASGTVNVIDLGSLRAHIYQGLSNLQRDDLNRDGMVSTADQTRLLDLFNGVHTSRAWPGARLPPCPADQ